MIGLDCNILVQLAIADHPAHQKTLAVVQDEIGQGTKLVFPSLVVTEFLHIVTDPRRFAPPLQMHEAIEWIHDFLANPAVELLGETQGSLNQTFLWMREFSLGRKHILDTHLAAILYTHEVHRLLTSNPSDFKVFGVLDVVVP